jgi:cobalt-zinc-cadmium efflux system membrane fusion protein
MNAAAAILKARVLRAFHDGGLLLSNLVCRAGLEDFLRPAGSPVDASAGPSGRGLPARHQWRILALVATVTIVAVSLTYGARALLFVDAGQTQSTGSADPPGTFRPTREQLADLVIRPVRRVVFRAETVTDGNIATDDDLSTPVFSPYSGRVTKLFAKLGDHVEKGAPLLAMEAAEFVQAQNDLITAASGLHSAQAQLNLARTNERREHELYDARGAALKDWQQSQSDLATAEGNFHTAEIALASVRNRLRIFGKSEQEIAALERGLAGQANPEATIAAPISGTVIQRQIGLGQFIQSGSSTPVFTIGNLSTVWFIANVRETDAPLIHPGDPVELRVLALPGRVFHAKISYVGASIDPVTHRLPVHADVENPDGVLKPQMFANISIVTGTGAEAPAVPQSAIIYEGDQARVWVETRGGALGLRQIRVGRTDGDLVEVLSGLSGGEKIVVSGGIFIDRAATGS